MSSVAVLLRICRISASTSAHGFFSHLLCRLVLQIIEEGQGKLSINAVPHIIIPMSEQIDQFFAPNGTLISIPVKPAKKIAVLKVIASKLSPDTKYPEKELNAIIATYHQDTAAIRRHMIEYGILERDGGSVYWVKALQPN